jgi:hypothetical protein
LNARELIELLHRHGINLRVEGVDDGQGCLVDGRLIAGPASKIGPRERALIERHRNLLVAFLSAFDVVENPADK